MTRTLTRLLTVLALVAVLAPGCGGGGDDGGGESVTLETRDNEFEPVEFEVAAGEVEITLDNTGEAEHNFANEQLDIDEDIEPGETTTFTVDAEPGTYEFVCKSHEALGMVGTMTVTE